VIESNKNNLVVSHSKILINNKVYIKQTTINKRNSSKNNADNNLEGENEIGENKPDKKEVRRTYYVY